MNLKLTKPIVFFDLETTGINIAKDRIVEMAWEDRTPFEAIEGLFGINSNQLIDIMRSELKIGSFKVWRKRMRGRQTKHLSLRPEGILRGYCKTQYKHSRGK